MVTLINLRSKLHQLYQQIGDGVSIIAVCKQQQFSAIKALIEAGVKDIAESRWQEIREKYSDQEWKFLRQHQVQVHYIGRLQSNKLKMIVRHVDVIHSIESLKHVMLVHKYALEFKKTLQVFIQLNWLAGLGDHSQDDIQRQGVLLSSPYKIPAALSKIVQFCKESSCLELQGFMTIGKPGDLVTTRQIFDKTAVLTQRLGLPHCSMGMSNDFPIAVSSGATVVRLGRILFESFAEGK